MQKHPIKAEPVAAASPRGRPRSFDRDRALGIAMRVFWLKGYSATSIHDLTEAIGIGPASLYAAFGSKDALYAEALQHYAGQHAPRIWGRFEAAGNVRDAIHALLHDSAAVFGRSEDCPAGCMVALSAAGEEGNDELGAQVRGLREDGLKRIRERLLRAPPGELPVGIEADALARFVLAVQGGMSLQARDGAGQCELQQLADAAMALWDGGPKTKG